MSAALAFAFSFPTWLCCDEHCRNEVAWEDAVAVLERGRLVGFRHLECSE